MAALPAGVQYGLSSESSFKENKELVFVKLTDSALKAIEDFIRNNRDKLAKPKIQFLPGNEGKISIPAPSSNNGAAAEATFHFSINTNAEMEGPQGCFECVRGGAAGARRLEACGALPRRMRVHANDDSYEATKDRMARTVAATHNKCTRVIKPNQTDIGRRVKVRAVTATQLAAGPPPAHAAHAVHASHAAPVDRLAHTAPPPRAVHAPHAPHPPQRPPPNPDLTRRSIKERLIQLLALKPFKKPELYVRLHSEGIKDKERSLVNKILPQISLLKDNCYHLRRSVWNDVNEDWPFYTEEEKRTLKRRKPQNLTPPLSSDSATSLSPRTSPGKRAAGGGAGGPGDELPCKKTRISHYRRPSPASSGYAGSGASSGERHVSDNEDDRNTVKKDNEYTLSFNTVKEILPSPEQNMYRNSPQEEQPNISVKDITNNQPLENAELELAPEENVTEIEDFEREYPAVTSWSTRRAYKDEFTQLYAEYSEMHARLSVVAQLFASLERQLLRARPHSPHYQSIKDRIVEEYRRSREDVEYQRERRRVNYLHRKLTHIKQMVAAYDDMQINAQSDRMSTASATQAY